MVHTVHAQDVARAAVLLAGQAADLDGRAFNVADDVPSRWLPSPPCARAEPCAVASASSAKASAWQRVALEVDIEL